MKCILLFFSSYISTNRVRTELPSSAFFLKKGVEIGCTFKSKGYIRVTISHNGKLRSTRFYYSRAWEWGFNRKKANIATHIQLSSFRQSTHIAIDRNNFNNLYEIISWGSKYPVLLNPVLRVVGINVYFME